MKCPLKLQEIHVINGIGDFSTKRFSVFGGLKDTGPWDWLFTVELEQGSNQV